MNVEARETHKLCSVLIPSRYRVPGLCRCIDTLLQTCENHNNVEFIVRIDDDDTETLDAIESGLFKPVLKACNLQFIVRPRLQLPFAEKFSAMFMECAEQANGQWLFFANNDMWMHKESANWDTQLLEVPTFGCLAVPEYNLWNNTIVRGQWHAWHFFWAPNKFWETIDEKQIGHPIDTWTLNILTGLGHGGFPQASKHWQLHYLKGVATAHTQMEDKCFQETGRKNFTD